METPAGELLVFIRARGRGRGSGAEIDNRIPWVWTSTVVVLSYAPDAEVP